MGDAVADANKDRPALKLPETKPKPVEKPSLPSSVTLEAPHGFIDDAGVHRYWHQHFVETDPDNIALLIARKARLVKE